ncbi:sphingosine-1-phosphate lyase [Venturia canescens]|uniref:sphingosine-1-phosphate lyase n=1 Tax=Venturia canescens TaxID=32260 RepID=UPI001C9D3847|nr:sphingosine-1-phosphate lyase [Venturia canescens]
MDCALKGVVNNVFKEKEPWQIVTITTTTVLGAVWVWNFVFQEESVYERGKRQVFKLVKMIPSVKKRLETELVAMNKSLEEDLLQRLKRDSFVTKLPEKGLTPEQVLDKVKKYTELGSYDWKGGKVSGTVYTDNEQLMNLIADVYGIASYTNPLHPDVFPGVCKMEAEVVRICCRLFHGDDNTCGTMTTGGTESILLACKTWRDYARDVKGVKHPEMVIPITAHTAFDKAAKYLKIRIRTIPVNPHSYTVSIEAMKKAINGNTIMLVGSTPNFPYGTMDNIEAISALGVKYDIPVHVDACLGGFLICFMPDAGYSVAPFDFSLPGVKSISADTHKYGYAPKGSSIVLYKDKKYRHYQYTITTDWVGGIYASPTVNGSRAGGVIATCWSSMMYFGFNGYVEATRSIIQTTRYVESELGKMDGLFIFGTPATSVIALGSKKFHIYRLSTGLSSRGWSLNPLQFPCGIHLCVTKVHTQPGVAEQFLADVREVLVEIAKNPNDELEGMLAMYGTSQAIPDRSIVGDFGKMFLDSVYSTPEI